MTCQDARARFSEWADGALGAVGRAEIDEHLAGCAECRRELARFERTVSLLRTVEPARAPVGFVDQVMERVRPRPWPRRIFDRLAPIRSWRVPVAATAMVATATLSVYVFQHTPELQRAARPEGPAGARVEREGLPDLQRSASELHSATPAQESVTSFSSSERSPVFRRPGRDDERTHASGAPDEEGVGFNRKSMAVPGSGLTDTLAQPGIRSEAPPAPHAPYPKPASPVPKAQAGPDVTPSLRAAPRPDATPSAPTTGESQDKAARTPPPSALTPLSGTVGRERQEPLSGIASTPPPSPPPSTSTARESQGLPAGSASTPSPPTPRSKSEEILTKSASGPPPTAPTSEPARREGDQTVAEKRPPPAAAPPALKLSPEQRERPDATVESARGQVASPAPSAMRLAPVPRVAGRLTVKDRQVADRELAELLTRVGGAMTARRAEAGSAVIDVVVPGAAYTAFAEGLGRIGSWAPDAEPAELPARVPVTIRIGQ